MDNNKKPSRPLLSKLFLALITVLITVGAIELLTRSTPGGDKFSIVNNLDSLKPSSNPVGDTLRELAWKSSFSKRGLEAPSRGPREGIWGEGVTPLKCAVSECNFRKFVPGIIELDGSGLQTVGNSANPSPHILIVGGSVAWGAGASDYILNMKTAARIAGRNGIPTVIVRQPFPGGKIFKTDLEKRIMELSNKDYEKVITPLYKHIGKVLEEMAKAGEIYYVDAANCFGDETATTFNDQWHFSDPGQEILAERIYTGLVPIINKILGKRGASPN